MNDIQLERQSQRDKGFDEAHDDRHASFELSAAASAYSEHVWKMHDAVALGMTYTIKVPPPQWPWRNGYRVEHWNPKSPREDLVKAAALLVAEIERIDRGAARG